MTRNHIHTSNARSSAGFAILKLIAAVAVVGSVSAVGWVTLRGGNGEGELSRDVHSVASISFNVTATGNGELRARLQTSLRSQLEQSTQIVEIVPEGTTVKEGDVIVELNGDAIQKRLDDELLVFESARSDVISAENNYEIQVSDNESALRKAILNLELAQLDLRKWQEGEVKEKQLELELDIERADREFDRLKAKAERSTELLANGFLSKDEYDTDQLRFVEAQSNMKTTKLSLLVYENFTFDKELKLKTSDVEEAAAEIDRVKRKNESELASKEANRTNRRRQLALRESRVEKLEQQLAACIIRAPTDGLVVYATSVSSGGHFRGNTDPFEVGSDIRPNQEIILLPDTREMIAAVKIPESMLGRVRTGQRAAVTIDAAQGRTFPGIVETIGVMAKTGGWRDPNVREYEVLIALDLGSETHNLKPSMRCESEIVLNEVSDALAVPVQSVFNEGSHRYVYTVVGDRYHQTEVRLGRRSDIFAEILSGLEPGQLVLKREPTEGRIIRATFEDSDEPEGRRQMAGQRRRAGATGAMPSTGGHQPQAGERSRGPRPSRGSGDGEHKGMPRGNDHAAADSGSDAHATPSHETDTPAGDEG